MTGGHALVPGICVLLAGRRPDQLTMGQSSLLR